MGHTFRNSPRCRLAWGAAGAADAAARGDIVVVVDVLSFSTSVSVATSRRAIVYPIPEADVDVEKDVPAEATWAVARGDVPERGRYSLSPLL